MTQIGNTTQREIYIQDLIKKEKDKQRLATLWMDREKEKEKEIEKPSQHSRNYTQGNPDLKQMFKDTVKLFE